MDPLTFYPGEELKASKLNDIVAAVREKNPRAANRFTAPTMPRPFDIVDMKQDGEDLKIWLMPSWIISGNETRNITFGGNPLTSGITVGDGDLYLDTSTGALEWGISSSKLLILKKLGAAHYENRHPSVISLGGDLGGATIVPKSYKFDPETEVWSVVFNPAKLWEHGLSGSKGHDIKLGDGTVNGTAEMELGEGNNEIYLTYTLETKSRVQENSPQLSLGDPGDGEAFVPDWDDSGTDGEMKQHIGTIIVNENSAPVWRPVAPHVIICAFIPGIKYSGGNFSPIAEYDSEAKMLKLKGFQQLVASGTGTALDIIKSDGPPDVQFRQIAERAMESGSEGGEAQIKVEEHGNAIVIRGNGYNASKLLPGGWKLEIKDGLIEDLSLV